MLQNHALEYLAITTVFSLIVYLFKQSIKNSFKKEAETQKKNNAESLASLQSDLKREISIQLIRYSTLQKERLKAIYNLHKEINKLQDFILRKINFLPMCPENQKINEIWSIHSRIFKTHKLINQSELFFSKNTINYLRDFINQTNLVKRNTLILRSENMSDQLVKTKKDDTKTIEESLEKLQKIKMVLIDEFRAILGVEPL